METQRNARIDNQDSTPGQNVPRCAEWTARLPVRGFVPAYKPLERLPVRRPVDRVAYIRSACAGRRVLDLGALDETAFEAKRGKGNGTWLHEEIGAVAADVLGVDSSSKLAAAGLPTGPKSRIVPGDVTNLAPVLNSLRFTPEVVVAGELIEHLHTPVEFLQSLRANPCLQGAMLVLTTPNATALHNILVGVAQRESCHEDHLLILSYKTLTTVMRRAGFSRWDLIPYYARFSEMKQRVSPRARRFIDVGERFVNLGEWLCPLLSFGWIVVAEV